MVLWPLPDCARECHVPLNRGCPEELRELTETIEEKNEGITPERSDRRNET